MTRFGVGLIGTGKHGARYAQHIVRDCPEVRLVGIARRSLEAAHVQAAQLGCQAYADYRELIAHPEVEALIVVVPPTLHVEIVEAAAAAGRAVLLEKPAAADVESGRAIMRAGRSSGIALMVAQTLRYNGVVRAVMAARQLVGRIHAVRISQRFEPSRPGWIDDPSVAGGGITLFTGVHSFDLARMLTGLEVDRVSCEIGRVGTVSTEDNFCAVMSMGGGEVLASVAGSRATASRSGPIEIAAERGQLIADHVLNTAVIVQGSKAVPIPLPEPVATVLDTLQDFVRAVRQGAPMPIPFADGLRAVAIAEACYRSAASRCAVEVERIDDQPSP